MIEMSDADLLSRLVNFEDHFVERKTVADLNDSLKTVVAFANSAPIGARASSISASGMTANSRQRHMISTRLKDPEPHLPENIPPRAVLPKIITNGRSTALAVIVYGSEQRPHFSGPSYIRQGSETFEASVDQFARLIAMRDTKVYFLTQHIGELVTVVIISVLGNGTIMRGSWGTVPKSSIATSSG